MGQRVHTGILEDFQTEPSSLVYDQTDHQETIKMAKKESYSLLASSLFFQHFHINFNSIALLFLLTEARMRQRADLGVKS